MGLRELTGVDCRDGPMPTYAASHCSLLIHTYMSLSWGPENMPVSGGRTSQDPWGLCAGAAISAVLSLKSTESDGVFAAGQQLGKLSVGSLMGTPSDACSGPGGTSLPGPKVRELYEKVFSSKSAPSN